MKKIKLTALRGFLLACCVMALQQLHSQGNGTVQITGVIKSAADSSGLAGATVTLASNKKIATITDATGKFVLTVPAGITPELLVSSVGFEKKTYSFNPGQSGITIMLVQDNNPLNEVVVTSLGIKKDRKALGYAVTEVKGSEFTQARENNLANALSGKVAGVNVAGLSTGPGGSSRVTIRGNGSLNGDNQPLYVVNGMPIDNSVPGGAPTVNGITNNVDRGDGIAGINPDDIESISVLKGGTAAALYGSRASNGVILITTKKGRAQRGIGVEYNSTATMENVAVIPDFQYEYGQGDGGVKPTTLAQAQATGRRSWGAKIDGSTDYVGVDGNTHPYLAQKDNLQNFYQTGTTFTNTLSFTGGNESLNYRFSASDLNSRGILPKTTYGRKTLNLALNGRLGDKISIEALAQYNLETGKNRTGAGDALGNPNWTPLEIANTADVRWLDPGYDANGNEKIWNDAAIASNGYFVINKFQQSDRKNRFIGQASISYEMVKDLVFKATISRDFYNYNYVNILPTGTLYVPNGQYQGIKSDVSETNGLVTASYKTNIGSSIGVSFMGGVNSRKFQNSQLNMNGAQFIIPYFYSFSNLATASTIPYTARITTNSIFGSADFDYKSILFVTVTGREDWFSTLSPANNHIFYPSLGSSFILSDAVRMPAFVSYAKLRGSWAQVGGGAPDPYAINLTYSNVPSSGPSLQNVTSNVISNPNLRPFTSTTYEAGIELQLFNSRLGVDFTYYNRKTTNDIVNTAISTTSGYSNVILNVGELNNKGIELLVTGKPVKAANFNWNVSYNIAYNQNKVVKLAPGLTSIQIANSVGNWAYLNHIEGQPFGTLVGTRILKDGEGNTVFNATTGLPVATPLQQLGNSVAPLTMGFTNEFRYKNFSLNVLLDGKFGNKVFSIFELYAMRMGKLKSTLPGRENGLLLEGVDQQGNKYSRTVEVANLRPYYDNNKSYSELFLHDGSFVKLRQIIFSYNIPVNKIKLLKLQAASISFVARNLAILYKKTDNFDPEQSFTNSNAQGFESIGLPRTRSYGLNLAVKF
ncbi:SusC/RagA family TonB-linked outer membrane protein [Foetidibacter luteolus]|uniref:SusC/RagA family TonB-linked outer membrane protein n=1 Tax=Foetidibacter luteolus TaxID=2608880 RepID=UPI00129B7331|nr:SusC/RagA family TonB-linked outer membrane protein [Foetidibacter luteolus]